MNNLKVTSEQSEVLDSLSSEGYSKSRNKNSDDISVMGGGGLSDKVNDM